MCRLFLFKQDISDFGKTSMRIVLCGIFFVFGLGELSAQDSTRQSLMLRQRPLTPKEIITGDTLRVDTSKPRTNLPGEYSTGFTPEQDSAYAQALRMNVPAGARLMMLNRLLSGNWDTYRAAIEATPEVAAQNVLNLPAEVYQPSAREQALYNFHLEQSMRVPFMRTLDLGGARIPMSAIGAMLGLTEDISPTMRFTVEQQVPVEVVVYSTQAMVIATVFRGVKMPGAYTYTWNGRDEAGKPMPPGDYIGEVRIGNQRLLRKRIQILSSRR